MMKYDHNKEYKADVRCAEIRARILECQKAYKAFVLEYVRKLDFANPQSIREAYQAASERGIFWQAKEIRELVFGKDMHFYGVVYLWDACMNHCAYCPGSVPNRRKALAAGKVYPLRELTAAQAVQDTLAVMRDGHRHICYLSGSAPGRERLPGKLVPYLEKIDELGLTEVILNIEPATAEGFAALRAAVKKASLQFRVFQETYDRDTYAKMHPCGPKADYDFRRQSQARAMKAGFDDVGLGVLFGLHRFPIEEIESLRMHADELESRYGKRPARICLPSANELTNIGVEIPYFLGRGEYQDGREVLVQAGDYELFNELIYALARLAMPLVNIVSSERDGPAMLRILDRYATCTTLNVHPGVGDNAGIFGCGGCNCAGKDGSEETHFEQATVFPREPKRAIEDMKKRGYVPIIGNTDKSD